MKRELEICDLCLSRERVRIAEGKCHCCGASLCASCMYSVAVTPTEYWLDGLDVIRSVSVIICKSNECMETLKNELLDFAKTAREFFGIEESDA